MPSARAETRQRVTVIVFTEYKLHESAWAPLLAALQRDLTDADQPSGPAIEVMRGDDVKRGMQVEQAVSVYLHGDCTLRPGPWQTANGTLGWVWRVHGQIEPFVHVDCTLLEHMLAHKAASINSNLWDQTMGEAIARVVEHEWLHIYTQSPEHSRHGVMKAQFTADDLLSADERHRAGRGLGR